MKSMISLFISRFLDKNKKIKTIKVRRTAILSICPDCETKLLVGDIFCPTCGRLLD